MNKYRSHPTTVDGIRFHSKREAARYGVLVMLQKAGEIRELELQPKFPLYVSAGTIRLSEGDPKTGEMFTKVCDYIADFRYRLPNGTVVIEDVKSPATRTEKLYRLKRKMVEAQYGIQITEV